MISPASLTKRLGLVFVFAAVCTGEEAYARTLHEGNNSGSLSSSDGTSVTRSGRYTDVWTFTLSTRTSVIISMTSSFDNYLILYRGSSPSSSTKVTQDDDGGPGANAEVSRTLDPGAYSIEATSYSSGTTGSYALDADLGGGGGGSTGCSGYPLGDYDYCSSSCPCSAGEGDCDGDSECASGLSCVNSVGADCGFSSDVDVCEGGGGSTGCSGYPLGDYDHCSSSCPCSAGEGDCDGDSECAFGLSCVNNVGADYGFSSGVDVCEGGGGSTCSGYPLGDYDYCSSSCPCSAGEGDCDGDRECASGLSCVNNVGADYGFDRGVDVCEGGGGGVGPLLGSNVLQLSAMALEQSVGRQELERRYNDENKKYLAFCGASVVELVGVKIFVDMNDYLGLTPEGRDGYVTVWLDVSAGSLGLPFSFGVLESDFSGQNPDANHTSSSVGVTLPCIEFTAFETTLDGQDLYGHTTGVFFGASFGGNFTAGGTVEMEKTQLDIAVDVSSFMYSPGAAIDLSGHAWDLIDNLVNLNSIWDLIHNFRWPVCIPASPSDDAPGWPCSGGGCHSDPLGDYDYCSSSCPCSAGEGDCDSDSECASGLSCVNNVGADYGFSSGVDVCEGG